MTETRIKVEEEGLLELAKEISGLQTAIEALSFVLGEKRKRLWVGLTAKYPQIPPVEDYSANTSYDHRTDELVIRKYGEK